MAGQDRTRYALVSSLSSRLWWLGARERPDLSDVTSSGTLSSGIFSGRAAAGDELDADQPPRTEFRCGFAERAWWVDCDCDCRLGEEKRSKTRSEGSRSCVGRELATFIFAFAFFSYCFTGQRCACRSRTPSHAVLPRSRMEAPGSRAECRVSQCLLGGRLLLRVVGSRRSLVGVAVLRKTNVQLRAGMRGTVF